MFTIQNPPAFTIDTQEPIRLLVFSDTHGSSSRIAAMLDYAKSMKPDAILLLGDLLYHGPRNPLPEGHNAAEAAVLLNGYKDSIIAIRGNCDAEVDQMVLDFPLTERLLLRIDGITIDMRHGHHELLPDRFETVAKGSILLCGHRHVPRVESVDGVHIWNVGSTSLPKQNSEPSYAIIESQGHGTGVGITLYAMNGSIIGEHHVPSPSAHA